MIIIFLIPFVLFFIVFPLLYLVVVAEAIKIGGEVAVGNDSPASNVSPGNSLPTGTRRYFSPKPNGARLRLLFDNVEQASRLFLPAGRRFHLAYPCAIPPKPHSI